jgi:hypothetical protein
VARKLSVLMHRLWGTAQLQLTNNHFIGDHDRPSAFLVVV